MANGYNSSYGFYARVDGRLMLFATEQEYLDYISEKEET